MKRAVFHPEASQEYLQAIEYHAAISVELGARFDSEIQRLVSEVSRDPQRCFPFHPPTRRALTRVSLLVRLSGRTGPRVDRGGDARQATARLLENAPRLKAAKAAFKTSAISGGFTR